VPDAVGEARERYASKAVKSKKQREAAAMARLSQFTAKLKGAQRDAKAPPPPGDTRADDNALRCDLHNLRKCKTCFPDLEDEPVDEDIFAHSLQACVIYLLLLTRMRSLLTV
jgi:hypothetical protein